MIREIVKYPAPVLSQVASPVNEVTEEIRLLLADMVQTMYAFEGVGLAAPQVGMGIRAIVIDIEAGSENQGKHVFKMVNPEILTREGELCWEEGCLSVPDLRVSMKRSEHIRARFLDENGTLHEIEAEGLLAVAIQHEIDHLDGKLIVDSVSRLKRDLYLRKRRKQEEEERKHPHNL